MLYTEQEQINWSKLSNLLEPKGVLDTHVCGLYLDACLRNTTEYVYQQEFQLETVYALLKKTDLPQSSTLFSNIYQRFRNTQASVEPFIGMLATHQPEKLKKWLKQALPNLDVTGQIMLLRDVHKWQPDEDLNNYMLKKLLTTKSDVVLKKLTPSIEDMPYLLNIARQFQKVLQFQSLGNSIIKGVFIARYGREDSRDPLEVKYSANNAFTLLQTHNVDIDAAELLRVVQLRYKAESIISDALAYPANVLKQKGSAPQEKLAISVLHATLNIFKADPSKAAPARKALTDIYETLNNYPQYRLEQESIQQVLTQQMIADQYTPFDAIKTWGHKIEPIVVDMIRAYQTVERDPDNRNLITSLYLGQRYAKSFFIYSQSELNMDIVRTAARAVVTPAQLVQVMQEHLSEVYTKYIGETLEERSLHSSLRDTLRNIAQAQLTSEEIKALKSTSIAPTMVLTYLLAAAILEEKQHVMLNNGILPNIEWQPLPLLKTLYPEHQELWYDMQCTLLKLKKIDIEAYKTIHANMFNIFSQAFLPNQLSLENVMHISNSLDVSPFTYVLNLCNHLNGEELHNIDTTVFSMDF